MNSTTFSFIQYVLKANTKMKRRDFIEKTAASTALLSLGLSLSSFKSR